jgi:hypothetical protein
MLYTQNINPYAGVAESAVTSASLFLGDAAQMTWSLTTSSATASRWTLQGNNGGGFTATLTEADWMDLTPVTAQGFYSSDSAGSLSGMARWGRFLRTPSHSSITIQTALLVRS